MLRPSTKLGMRKLSMKELAVSENLLPEPRRRMKIGHRRISVDFPGAFVVPRRASGAG